MNRKVVWGIVILIIIVILVIYNKKSQTGSVKIGLIAPLTGLVVNGDNLGQGFANAAILAEEEFIKKGGKLKIDMIVEDDGFDSKKGLSAYQKLVSVDKIDSLINLSSPTIDVAKTSIHNGGLPVIQLGAESEITKDNIFQIYPDQTSVGMLGEVANKDGVKTMTVVMEQVNAYEKFISDFEKNFSGKTEIIRIPESEKDYSSAALKIKQTNSDGLLIFTSSVIGSKVISKINQLSYKPSHLYFDLGLQIGINDYKTALGTSTKSLEGAQALYALTKTDPTFTSDYKTRFGSDPSFLSSYGYDAFNVMVLTYDSNKTKWIKNIQNYNGEGVSGKISFDKIGLRPPEFTIATMNNGELVTK